MDLNPLSTYALDRATAAADAVYILNALVGEANALTEYPEGNPVEAGDVVMITKNYFAADMAKLWRYLLEESVTVSVPRNTFNAPTDRMGFTVGTQNVAVIFDENANTVSLETIKV